MADTWYDKNSSTLIKLLEKDATNKYVAAIGECGILTPNGNLKLPSFDKQKELFRQQVNRRLSISKDKLHIKIYLVHI